VSASSTRTLCPPQRRVAEVRDTRRLGAYDLISARDLAGPPDPRPGQFYMLATGDRWGGGTGERPYLPRAFSFARARADAGGGADLQFLLEDVGPGTRRLGELVAGDALMLLGPLGAGFSPPAGAGTALLVGGGIGAAPILALHEERPSAPVVLGFRSAAHAEAAALFGEVAELTTDDGSAGRHGLVTEPLRELLDANPSATVYACGPPPMLEAVRALCAEREIPAQLALEAGMACGYGACFGCVIPTRQGYARVCVDGPVFEAAALEPSALMSDV
jgi:NAD(P)H-flavin reductase